MRKLPFYLAAAALVFSAAGFAAPADDAKRHFEAIAAGDVDDIMASYSDKAMFEWVGGPLDGTYTGKEAIRGVWTKFAKANAPLEVKVSKLEESANPAGATVTANVEFKGKNTIKVRYVLNYRNGKLTNEVWQIDPKLAVAGY